MKKVRVIPGGLSEDGRYMGSGNLLVPKQAGADEPPQERGKGRSGQGREAKGESPGKGNGNPLQYICLGNPMETGTWLAPPWVQEQSDMTKQLAQGLNF